MLRAVKPTLSAPLLAGSFLQDQIDTELRAVDAGVIRYRGLVNDTVRRGDGASIKPAERLCRHWFPIVTEIFDGEILDAEAGIPGPGRQITSPLLRQLTAEKLAVIVMHETLGACMAADEVVGTIPGDPTRTLQHEQAVSMAKLAYSVGKAAIAEIHLAMGKQSHRESLRQLEFSARELSVERVNWWARKNLDDAKTGRRAITTLGSVMLMCLLDGAAAGPYDPDNFEPAFNQFSLRLNGRTTSYVALTPRAQAVIDEGVGMRETLRPRYLPMVVEPFPWQERTKDTPRTEGGYVRIRTPLVSKPTPSQKHALEEADLSRVFEAINGLGSVPLAINRRVLDIQKWVWDTGGGELGLPRRDAEPKPPKPDGFDDMTPAEKKPWKKSAVEVHRRNIAGRSARVGYLSMLGVADDFAARETIYYPHQLDFRGRAYPIPAHLNHQGDDARVSLLRFSNAVEPDSLRWLLIHAANCYGMNKLSLNERYEWAADHLPQIAACAANPRDNDWWHHADESRPGAKDGKPWQFLAACFAIYYPEDGARQPVSVDGTCNGLQWYTGLTRDAESAAMVNMLPSTESDKPSSAYYRIVDEVRAIVQRDILDDGERTLSFDTDAGRVTMRIGEVAKLTLPHVHKATVKQPFMTKFYNVTATGARKQIQGVLKDIGVAKEHRYPIAKYMAEMILKGVATVCTGADSAMEWMRACASLIAAKNRPVTWLTPLGFPVVQPYRRLSTIQFITILGNLTLAIDDDKLPVAVRKQVDGCPPNVIHSFDATHMFMTSNECRSRGIDFLSTHDRYFAHAQHLPRLRRTIAEKFVELNETNLLAGIASQWRAKHPDIEFPSVPAYGTFDLRDVLESAYFFS